MGERGGLCTFTDGRELAGLSLLGVPEPKTQWGPGRQSSRPHSACKAVQFPRKFPVEGQHQWPDVLPQTTRVVVSAATLQPGGDPCGHVEALG